MKFKPFSSNAFLAVIVFSLLFALMNTAIAQKQLALTSAKAPLVIGCGTISKSGSYVLTGTGAGEDVCLKVMADNVTIHLAGASIAAAGGGIYANSVQNLVIIGPGTLSGEGPGIELINVTNSQVIGTTCIGDGVGIHIHNDASVPAHNRIVANKAQAAFIGSGVIAESQGNVYLGNDVCGGGSNVGLSIAGGEGDFIKGNRCDQVIDTGFAISGTHEIIVGNVADHGISSGSVGIFVDGTDNFIRNNEAHGNPRGDLVDNTGACGNNTWKANAFLTANLACIN